MLVFLWLGCSIKLIDFFFQENSLVKLRGLFNFLMARLARLHHVDKNLADS